MRRDEGDDRSRPAADARDRGRAARGRRGRRRPARGVGLTADPGRQRRERATAPDAALPRRVVKPWGYEVWYALTERYAGKLLHVERGHRLSLQFHERKDESCYLLSGRLLLVQGSSVDSLVERVVEPGAAWRNRPGDVHTIEALEDADVLEVSTPDLDDVVRLSDNYGRAGTSGP